MDIVGKRKIWYLISAILIIPGIISLFLWGLKLGIDFKGGTLAEYEFIKTTSVEEVKNALKEQNIQNLSVLSTGSQTILIRAETIDQEKHQKLIDNLAKIGENKEIRYESVGPTVSSNIRNKAYWAVGFASLAIILYIAFTFRRVPRPASSWRFGICAVIALLHDLIFVIGLFSILGHFLNYEIDSLFITALLTIMGFSVHDTIVVFDRIRENLRKNPSKSFSENVNTSIIQTLNRSLNTSLTVIIVLSSLYFLGGKTLEHFVLALLVGITIGTYSSIFNASQLLVSWQGWITNRLKKENAS
jgi:preprotein translocase subunit SecF